MTRHTSLAIDDQAAEFIDAQIDAGRFASPSDVVNAGLRLLEERENKVRALKTALEKGDTSGRIRDFDKVAFLSEMRRNFKG